MSNPNARGDQVIIYERDPDATIDALAQLDSSRCPAGRVLVAAVGGEPRAAVPLAGGRAIAHPFHRTAELVELLELRVAQLGSRPERGRLIRLADTLRRRRRPPSQPRPAIHPLPSTGGTR